MRQINAIYYGIVISNGLLYPSTGKMFGRKWRVGGNKKTPAFSGAGRLCSFPSSRGMQLSAGIGTLPVRTSGLPGFIGPSPSTSLDESDLHSYAIVLSMCDTAGKAYIVYILPTTTF